MSTTKDNKYVRLMKQNPISLDEWDVMNKEWTMNNPGGCQVIEMVHNMAQFFENEQGLNRREVCEALTQAVLGLAFRRDDERFIQKPEDQRAFHLWMLERLKMEIDVTTTEEQQSNYENELGKHPLWLFDSENFGTKDDEKSRH